MDEMDNSQQVSISELHSELGSAETAPTVEMDQQAESMVEPQMESISESCGEVDCTETAPAVEIDKSIETCAEVDSAETAPAVEIEKPQDESVETPTSTEGDSAETAPAVEIDKVQDEPMVDAVGDMYPAQQESIIEKQIEADKQQEQVELGKPVEGTLGEPNLDWDNPDEEEPMDEEYHVEALDQLCRICLSFHDDKNLIDRRSLAQSFEHLYKINVFEEPDRLYPPNVCLPCNVNMKKRRMRKLTSGPFSFEPLPLFTPHSSGCDICLRFRAWEKGESAAKESSDGQEIRIVDCSSLKPVDDYYRVEINDENSSLPSTVTDAAKSGAKAQLTVVRACDDENSEETNAASVGLAQRRKEFMNVLSMSAKYEKPAETVPRRSAQSTERQQTKVAITRDADRSPTSNVVNLVRDNPKDDNMAECPYCKVLIPKRFFIEDKLNSHKYPCRTCRMRFSTKPELGAHLKNWHAEGKAADEIELDNCQPVVKLEPLVMSVEEEDNSKSFRCLCKTTFSNLDDWEKHSQECKLVIIPKTEVIDEGYCATYLEPVDDEEDIAAMADLPVEEDDMNERGNDDQDEEWTVADDEKKPKIKKSQDKTSKDKKSKEETKKQESKKQKSKPKETTVVFKCGVCHKLFQNRQECTAHANTCVELKCGYCKTCFTTPAERDAHLLLCDGRIRCARCRQRVTDDNFHVQHRKAMESDAKKCRVCSKKDIPYEELAHHMDTVHGGIVEIFTCDICNVQVDRHVLMKKHLLVHMGDRKWYACDICSPGIWTTDKRVFNLHLLNSHLTPVRLACNLCPQLNPSKTLISREQWYTHFRVKHGRCPICRVRFNDKRKYCHPDYIAKCCLPLYSDQLSFEEMRQNCNPATPVYKERTAPGQPRFNDDDVVGSKPTGGKATAGQGKSAGAKTSQASKVVTIIDKKEQYVPPSQGTAPGNKAQKGPAPSKAQTGQSSDKMQIGKTQTKSFSTSSVAMIAPVKKSSAKRKVVEIEKPPSESGQPSKPVIIGDIASFPGHKDKEVFVNILNKMAEQLPSAATYLNQRQCDSCGLEFPTNVDVAVHMLLVHTCYVAEDDLYKPFFAVHTRPAFNGKAILMGKIRCLLCDLIVVDAPVVFLIRHAMECCKCPGCALRFPDRNSFQMHITESVCGLSRPKHIVYPKLLCKICPTRLPILNMMDHLSRHVSFGNACEVCKLKFADRESCMKHVSTHTDCQPWCFTCGKFTNSLAEYSQHLMLGASVHRGKSVKCWLCKESADSERSMRLHLMENHVCDLCGLELQNKNELTKHKCSEKSSGRGAQMTAEELKKVPNVDEVLALNHIGDRRYERCNCEICDRVYLSKTFWRAHTKRQHNSLDSCSTCIRLSVHKEHLRRHQAMRHSNNHFAPIEQRGLARHECNHCSFSGTSELVLWAHESVSHPHECPVCSQRFSQVKDLFAHCTHCHEESYRCTECYASHVTQHSHDLHLATHKKNKFLCAYCKSSFDDVECARDHAFSAHDFETLLEKVPLPPVADEEEENTDEPRMCMHCGEVFPACDLRKHESRCLTQVKFTDLPCIKCSATFQSEEALQRHMKSHVLLFTQGTQTQVSFQRTTPPDSNEMPGTTRNDTAIESRVTTAKKTNNIGKSVKKNDSTSRGKPKKPAKRKNESKKDVGKKKPRKEEFDVSETSEDDSDEIPYDDTPDIADLEVQKEFENREKDMFDDRSESESEIGDGDSGLMAGGEDTQAQTPSVEYSCAACEGDPNKPSRFSSLPLLNKHMKIVHNSVPEFDEKVTMKLEKERKQPRFSCDNCDKVYASKSGLLNHQKQCVAPAEAQASSFRCGMCQAMFTSKAGFAQHFRTVHLTQPKPEPIQTMNIVECEVCNRKFANVAALWKHSQMHD